MRKYHNNIEQNIEKYKRQKTKAEDNTWYLLATLYGVNDKQHNNMSAWNKYFHGNLDTATQEEFRDKFKARCRELGKDLSLPEYDANIDFSNVEFDQDISFEGFHFVRPVRFDGATFSGDANFQSAYFYQRISFENAEFSRSVDFHEVTFCGVADFDGATFSQEAHFNNAKFSNEVVFRSMTFSAWTFFANATFSSQADFFDAKFLAGAGFESATFSSTAIFAKAAFHEESYFINTEMKSTTSFEGTKFLTEPPRFFGAKLHQGTVWHNIIWPKPPPPNKARLFIDAYACLKLEMDRLKKHEDELKFFALEMEARRVLLGWRQGLPIAIYGVVSNYGLSYGRPLYWLLATVVIGTGTFFWFTDLSIYTSIGFSLANILNVFGFRREFFDPHFIENLPVWIKVVTAGQTLFGAICLFLIGLGIRNRFRMK
ncbi:pentapeptide repeat-containing protein [Beijerinckia mobilis]|uniref:pentapeptide repeat-containing protein n=1 Tax=Beijerinckia mobilis TaxID=231434 RepID=UPI0005593077|nr:pentapeptide repeat-containing protein [Beijerinckia mobilis]